MNKDSLGDRMKYQYENRTRYMLPRRTYTVIRLDGKSFHTYTKGFQRPYDIRLMTAMDQTALALCEKIQGAHVAYVQSDEISILITDFDKTVTQAWFDGNIQKITSISAAIATAHFNQLMINTVPVLAYFDSRVFTIPDQIEVQNYMIWRQKDAERNSLQMVAQSLYSQKELQGKKTAQLHELIYDKGHNWNNYPDGFKRGRVIVRDIPGNWIVDQSPPVFCREGGREYLDIPEMPRYELESA